MHLHSRPTYVIQSYLSRSKSVFGTDVYPHMPILRPHATRFHERRFSSVTFTQAHLYGDVYMRVGRGPRSSRFIRFWAFHSYFCRVRAYGSVIRSPVLWTVDLMFCACFFFFLVPTHFFRRLQADIFETFPHDVALLEKAALRYADFLKVPPNQKWGAKNPKFRPISRLIATYYAPSLVMWKENRKSKTIVFISEQDGRSTTSSELTR